MTARVKLELSAECVAHLERALMWRLSRLHNLEKSARARGDNAKATKLFDARTKYLAALSEWVAAKDSAAMVPLDAFLKSQSEGGGA